MKTKALLHYSDKAVYIPNYFCEEERQVHGKSFESYVINILGNYNNDKIIKSSVKNKTMADDDISERQLTYTDRFDAFTMRNFPIQIKTHRGNNIELGSYFHASSHRNSFFLIVGQYTAETKFKPELQDIECYSINIDEWKRHFESDEYEKEEYEDSLKNIIKNKKISFKDDDIAKTKWKAITSKMKDERSYHMGHSCIKLNFKRGSETKYRSPRLQCSVHKNDLSNTSGLIFKKIVINGTTPIDQKHSLLKQFLSNYQ